jgi:hypothetical protein
MQPSSRSRKVRSATALCTAVTLAAAPAALARPADQGAQPSPSPAVAHLSPAQLRAVDGHQPREAAKAVSHPAASRPGGGSGDADLWLITGGAAAALLAAGGLAGVTARRERGPVPRPHAGV